LATGLASSLSLLSSQPPFLAFAAGFVTGAGLGFLVGLISSSLSSLSFPNNPFDLAWVVANYLVSGLGSGFFPKLKSKSSSSSSSESTRFLLPFNATPAVGLRAKGFC
jgi:hypothetical protein